MISMMRKTAINGLVLSVALICFSSVQADSADVGSASSWVGSVALASRYTSRGLDVTDGVLSPQAGIEYRSASGWYANEFIAKMRYFGMSIEADTAVGFRGARGPLQYDLGLYYYAYPDADPQLHSNFAEVGGRFTWAQGLVHPVAEIYLSNNYFFAAGPGVFANVGADVALPGHVAMSARFGYVRVKDTVAFIYPNYSTWSVSALRSVGPWDLSAQVTDTSMRRSQCIDENRCSVKWTLRVARNF